MGNWHELAKIPNGNDLTLYSMPTHKLPPHNYESLSSISQDRQKFDKPSLEELTSLLNYHCAELEIIRGKTVIGYYANSNTWSRGYNKIHNEDVEHMREEIVNKISDNIKELDFILSSPGGYIEPSFKLSDMIRKRFEQVSYLLFGSIGLSATGMTFGGDEIIMQSSANLSPINPIVNGIDTYVGKQDFKIYRRYKIFAPWVLKYLNEAKIAENGVKMKTLISIERFVFKRAHSMLSRYLFKVYQLRVLERIKIKIKITKIVKYFLKHKFFPNFTYFYSNDILSSGLPICLANTELEKKLQIIKNICYAITSTTWSNGEYEIYIRKIYFSSKDCHILRYLPEKTSELIESRTSHDGFYYHF